MIAQDQAGEAERRNHADDREPQSAVKEIQGGYQVALLSAENKAIIRQVKAGEKVGTMWVIEDGLKPGDPVIVEGIGKVKDGTPVVPKTVSIQGEGQ